MQAAFTGAEGSCRQTAPIATDQRCVEFGSTSAVDSTFFVSSLELAFRVRG